MLGFKIQLEAPWKVNFVTLRRHPLEPINIMRTIFKQGSGLPQNMTITAFELRNRNGLEPNLYYTTVNSATDIISRAPDKTHIFNPIISLSNNLVKRIRYVDMQMRLTISSCSCERGII